VERNAGPIVYPVPPWQQAGGGGVAGAMRLFGPGAIIASVSIASGETLFSSRAGALFGYSLLWFIFFCAGCKLVQVYTAGRYMVLAGEHPMEAWMRLPGPRGWFPILLGTLSIFCMPFWMGGLAGMLGTAVNWIFGLGSRSESSQYFWAHVFATTALVIAAVLTLIQTYDILEIIMTVIVGLLLVGILAAVAVARVDWEAALRGLVVHLPRFEPWVSQYYPDIPRRETPILVLVVFMGAIGGGSYDYIGYLSFFREKGWGAIIPQRTGEAWIEPALACRPVLLTSQNLSTGRSWLRAPAIDVFTSFVCVALFTAAFNLLGASILHPKRLVPGGFALLTPQVEFLTGVHPSLRYLYYLGIFIAFWKTIYGALELYSRTAYESLRPLSRRARRVSYRIFRICVVLYAGVGAVALLWTLKDPMEVVKPAALVGTITCGLWCFAMIWTDRRCLPRPLQMNGVMLALNVIAGCALCGFGTAAMIDYLRGLIS
jgi:Mn2+/Fe2+ NRAMP family transporter